MTPQGFQWQVQAFQEGSRNDAVTDGNIYFFESLPLQMSSELQVN